MTVTPSAPVVTETDALKIVVSAAGDVCPVHVVGPVANHLVGSVSALRPYGHPDHADNKSGHRRSKAAVDRLIADAIANDTIECVCSINIRHPLAVVIHKISDGAFVRAHPSDMIWQQNVQRAIASADVDLLTWYVEPRLEMVKQLFDHARAQEGGTLPGPVMQSVAPLVQSLAGPTRWDVRQGLHDGWRWSAPWRPGVVFDQADAFMTHAVVYRSVIKRILNGSL